MKTSFQKAAIAGFLLIMVIFVAACAKEGDYVRRYNDEIVGLQENMMEKWQKVMQDFAGDHLDIDKTISELQEVQKYIQQTYDEFQKINVPRGAETLSVSMKNFFEVDLDGIKTLVVAAENLKGKEKDQKAIDTFLDAINDFMQKEQEALSSFQEVQQQVAQKYGQKVQITQ